MRSTPCQGIPHELGPLDRDAPRPDPHGRLAARPEPHGRAERRRPAREHVGPEGVRGQVDAHERPPELRALPAPSATAPAPPRIFTKSGLPEL